MFIKVAAVAGFLLTDRTEATGLLLWFYPWVPTASNFFCDLEPTIGETAAFAAYLACTVPAFFLQTWIPVQLAIFLYRRDSK